MRKAAGRKYRVLCAAMAVMVVFSQADLRAAADTGNQVIHIRDEGEFYLFAEQCKAENFSAGKTFYLENDLDFSEYEDLFVPVMAGTFEGNGHQITGLVLSEDMSDYGLFRYVSESGVIRNLTVEAQVTSGGEQEHIGILAGSNAGMILDCVSQGNVNGQKSVGGIAGNNEAAGSIRRCINEAKIDGKEATGGIAGNNEGLITDCTNTGSINTSRKVVKEMDGDGSVTVSIPNAVTGLVADDRANETGGIAGNSSGTISYCENKGTIGYEHLGHSTGGIVGRQNGSVSYCSNEGKVSGRKDVGGIVGYFEPYEAASYDRDYSEELSDQLDELSDLVDNLGDTGERLGDHMSGNLEELSDKMKALKDSVRKHLDDFEDLTDDSRDAISSQVDDVKEALEGMQLNVNMNQLGGHIAQIEKDMAQIQEILEKLAPYLESADADVKENLQQIIGKYDGQLQELRQALEALKQYIEDQAKNGNADGDESVDGGGSIGGDGSTAGEETAPGSAGTSEGNAVGGTGDDTTGENPSGGEVTGGSEEAGNGSEDADEPSGDHEEAAPSEDSVSDGEDTARSGHMQTVAFTTVKVTDEEAAQIAAAIQELEALSADIQTQVQGIAEILGTMPGELSRFQTNFHKLGNEIGDLTDTLDDELDDWADELGDMKDDIRAHGDGISGSLDQTTDELDADWEEFSDGLDRVKDKFRDIRAVITDGFDELKNRLEDRSIYVDVSELATDEPGEGKIVSCTNEGEIISDSQAGGIVGSITKVSGSDVTGWFFDGAQDEEEDEKDSITKHVLALVTGCKNVSEVSVQDDYAGGIVGKADYGMVNSCQNYGDILSKDGGYVGGIAGKTEYGIRGSHVLCGLKGDSYVGGVAGSGEDISGSYVCAYMDMEDYVKSSGAIAGHSDGLVENNYFVDNGYGAVDGVTRSLEAIAVDYASMLELKEMPKEFTEFTIRFRDGEDTVWEGTFSYGDEFPAENYPKLTEPEGEYAYWEDKTVSPVRRNVTVHAVYRVNIPSLASGVNGELSSVLLGGEFYPDSVLTVKEASKEEEDRIIQKLDELDMLPRYVVKEIYSYRIDQEEPLTGQISLRVKDHSALADSLMVLSGELEVTEKARKAEVIGSYLAIDTSIGSSGYIIVLDKVSRWMIVAALAGGGIFLTLAFLVIWRRRKKKGTEVEDAEGHENP